MTFRSIFLTIACLTAAGSELAIAGDDLYRPFLINRVFNYYGNNGDGAFNKFSSSNEGFEFTKGSGKTCVFEEGIVWGGYHKGRATPKIGGSVYRHGLQAGPIITPGTPSTDPVGDDPTNPANRIYRVRPDINPRTQFTDVEALITSSEIPYVGRYESYTSQDIYNQYVNDWNQWPAAEGAPFAYGKDSNNVQRTGGPYDPRYDVPGRPGADQTLWYVANDCNPTRAAFLAGSPVIGLEMQRTIWGYNRANAMGQTIFESTLLINKSGAEIDTMYLAQFADPDLGSGTQNYVGYDTTRNLGYVYNGTSTDPVFGTAIPATGFDIVQGPAVPGAPSDTAAFHLRKRPGYKNIPLSAFVFFISTVAAYQDPIQGAGGDVQWYRLLRGTIASTGAPFIDPVTAKPTKFCLYGDPASGGPGWIASMTFTPQDVRFGMSTGPFTLAAGDTQEIVSALTAGLGADYLSSIGVLRSADDIVQNAYNAMTGVGPVLGITSKADAAPVSFALNQNYPNPFNPSTVISYTLSRRSNVRLSVYNELGQVVSNLVSRVEDPGTHEVKFTADGLASGIYFYRLQTDESVATKKLILIR